MERFAFYLAATTTKEMWICVYKNGMQYDVATLPFYKKYNRSEKMLQRDNGHLKMVFHIKFGNSFVMMMTVDYHILETIALC